MKRRRKAGACVLRASTVDVAGAENAVHGAAQEQRTVVVNDRIAPVDRDSIPPVPLENAPQARSGEVERLVPRDRLETVGPDATQWPSETVGVIVHLRDRHPLRACVALRNRVVVVGPNRDNAISVQLEAQAASRFTERAGAVDRLL